MVRLGLCVILVLLGTSVIIGWLAQVEQLKSVVPGLSTMKFNAASSFVLVGIGLAAAPYKAGWLKALSLTCGGLLLAVGLATLMQYGSGIQLGIDEAIVADRGTLRGSGFPGRMSPLTATAFASLGLAILLIATGAKRSHIVVGHALGCVAAVVSLLAAAGYTFGAEAFWGIGFYTFMAVHTAVGLMIASAATLMTSAQQGWLEPYVKSPAARDLLLRLLPLALAIPIGLGLTLMLGAGLGAFNAPYAFALFIPLTSVAMTLAALWVASRQRESELLKQQYERHLQIVVAELNHRVKNTLSIVQSFAHQSLAGANSPQEARSAFEGRLSALATAHNLLTQQNWDHVGLEQLIRGCVDVHDDTGTRFVVDGPDFNVGPKASVTMAMTLHELATNSTKYGALSSPEGSVRITWRVKPDEFCLEWKDVGGPPCTPPSRRGFGTRMLERALPSEIGGRATLDFAPDGLRYEVRGPGLLSLGDARPAQ